MRDSLFFQEIEQTTIIREPHTFCNPTFYYDASLLTASLVTPLGRALQHLPSPRMHPLRVTPWHTVTQISCFEYRDSDIGPYNEVSIAFPITIGRAAPVLWGLLSQMKQGPTGYVWHLPVTTQIALDGGVWFYNFPKFLAEITFEQDAGWTHCRLAENGEHILTLSGRHLPLKPSEQARMHAITVRGSRMLRSEFIIRGEQHGMSRRPKDVRLELGTHRIATELRALKMGRPLLYETVPEAQAVLSGPLESMPMN